MQYVNLSSKTDSSSIYPPPSTNEHSAHNKSTDRKIDENTIVLSLLPPIQGDEYPTESSLHVYTTENSRVMDPSSSTVEITPPTNDSGNELNTENGNKPNNSSRYYTYQQYLLNDKPTLQYFTGMPMVRSLSTLFVNPMLQQQGLSSLASANHDNTNVPTPPPAFRQRYPLFVNPSLYHPIYRSSIEHQPDVETETIVDYHKQFHEVTTEPMWLEQLLTTSTQTQQFTGQQTETETEKSDEGAPVLFKEKFENTIARLTSFDHASLIESIADKGISASLEIHGNPKATTSKEITQLKPTSQAMHKKCKLLIGFPKDEFETERFKDLLRQIFNCDDTTHLEPKQFDDLDLRIRAELARVPGDYLVKLKKPGRAQYFNEKTEQEYIHSFELHRSALAIMSTRKDILPDCCSEYLREVDDETEFWKLYFVYRGWYFDYQTDHMLKEEFLIECYKFAVEMKVESAVHQFTSVLIDRMNEKNWLIFYGLAMASGNQVLKTACGVYFLRTINCGQCTHILNALLHNITLLYTNAEGEFDALIKRLDTLDRLLYPKIKNVDNQLQTTRHI